MFLCVSGCFRYYWFFSCTFTWHLPGLFWVYSHLSHRAMEYYYGSPGLKGCGLSKHWWLDRMTTQFWTTLWGYTTDFISSFLYSTHVQSVCLPRKPFVAVFVLSCLVLTWTSGVDLFDHRFIWTYRNIRGPLHQDSKTYRLEQTRKPRPDQEKHALAGWMTVRCTSDSCQVLVLSNSQSISICVSWSLTVLLLQWQCKSSETLWKPAAASRLRMDTVHNIDHAVSINIYQYLSTSISIHFGIRSITIFPCYLTSKKNLVLRPTPLSGRLSGGITFFPMIQDRGKLWPFRFCKRQLWSVSGRDPDWSTMTGIAWVRPDAQFRCGNLSRLYKLMVLASNYINTSWRWRPISTANGFGTSFWPQRSKNLKGAAVEASLDCWVASMSPLAVPWWAICSCFVFTWLIAFIKANLYILYYNILYILYIL